MCFGSVCIKGVGGERWVGLVYRSGVLMAEVLFGKRWRQVSLDACDVTRTMPLYYAHAHNSLSLSYALSFSRSLPSTNTSTECNLYVYTPSKLVYETYFHSIWCLTYIHVYKTREAHGTLQILSCR